LTGQVFFSSNVLNLTTPTHDCPQITQMDADPLKRAGDFLECTASSALRSAMRMIVIVVVIELRRLLHLQAVRVGAARLQGR